MRLQVSKQLDNTILVYTDAIHGWVLTGTEVGKWRTIVSRKHRGELAVSDVGFGFRICVQEATIF